ncbi:MAG TPA: hypothetical protein VG797_07865 [Phycisphaerales bacterium]|nr:hypothetical protein [Phycisphaerales bacterium]
MPHHGDEVSIPMRDWDLPDSQPEADSGFDALAELFLGSDDGPVPDANGDTATIPAIDPVRPVCTSQQSETPLAPAQPMNIPSVAATPHPAAESTPDPESPAAGPQPEPPSIAAIEQSEPLRHPMRPPMVELLLMGHLPVRGSPWPAQYARELLDLIDAPVLLARLRAGECSVELYGGDRSAISAPVDDLDDALALAGALAQRRLLMCDTRDAAKLADDARITRVTILAGANDAAVAAAYQSIKDILAHRRREHAISFGIAVVGAGRKEAADAVARVNRACHAFLGTSAELSAVVERMRPTGTLAIFRGSCDLSPARLLTNLLAVPPTVPPQPRKLPIEQRRARVPTSIEPDIASAPVVAAPVAKTDHSQAASGAAPAPTPIATESDAKPQTGAAASTPRSHDPELFKHVHGLIPLAFRCPFDQGVELAADRDGTLHILLADEAMPLAEPSAAQPGDLPAHRVERLIAVSAWARKHLELIALAAAAIMPIDSVRPPVMHFFTPRPKSVRALLDAEVRLHALAPVHIEQRTAWCCLELN